MSGRCVQSKPYNIFCSHVEQVEDTPGNDEVALSRKFGNEKYASQHLRHVKQDLIRAITASA